MRFLADENVPGLAVEALRKHGHDVLWVRSDAPGSADEIVLERAAREVRILITLDKDFGELAWKYGLPASAGIILLRLSKVNPSLLAQMIITAIASTNEWVGNFAVIEPDRIRIRSLPSISKQ